MHNAVLRAEALTKRSAGCRRASRIGGRQTDSYGIRGLVGPFLRVPNLPDLSVVEVEGNLLERPRWARSSLRAVLTWSTSATPPKSQVRPPM
jgi:hypothetical protein